MISVLPLVLELEPERGIDLPSYSGSLWRGALGARLRRDACITGASTCEGCAVRAGCAYGRVFSPGADRDSVGLNARFRDLPRPYVISPRHRGGRKAPGERLRVDLTLLGPAIADFPAIRRAAVRLQIHRTPLRLARMSVTPPNGEAATDAMPLATATACAITPPAAPVAVRLTFDQPLRLRRDNRYLDRSGFSLATFISALLRRISSLHDLASQIPMQADYAAIVAHAQKRLALEGVALEWRDWSRHSARQKRHVPMGGLVGQMTLRGDLTPVWPWLWTGQWTHVGKGAVMGMGRYRLHPLQ